VDAFFGGCGEFSAIFLNRVFELPLLRNTQKRDKKIEQKNEGGKTKKTEDKIATIFCDGAQMFF
jgi:hypothetical protein